jgi:hypothetical protein
MELIRTALLLSSNASRAVQSTHRAEVARHLAGQIHQMGAPQRKFRAVYRAMRFVDRSASAIR